MAAGGYPGAYDKGRRISGIPQADALEGVTVFHAGVALSDAERHLTSGGRVLGVTAKGPTLADALERAYAGVERISWDGAQHRSDIGGRQVGR